MSVETITPIKQQKVLIDHQGSLKMVLSEDKEGKKLFAEGKIGQCDVPTANGRIYTRAVMEREVARLQERINNASLLGAVDHPGDGKARIMEAGHIVRKLWIERDGSVHGKFEIVEESDAGHNLAAFLRRGASIGMSSRGLGSTHQNESGQEVVGEDFKLSSYDFVSDPAVSTAYPQFFTEDKDLQEKVTVDAIRAKFPHLVRQIEESAHEVAKDTTIEAVRAEMETEVEQALLASKDKLKEEIKIQVLPDILKEVRDDFGNKLVKALQGMRKEVEESVRSEFASDPKVAGAKLTLEQIAKMITPFSPPMDVKQILDAKDSTMEGVKAELEATKKQVAEAKEVVEQKNDLARGLGYQLYIEKALRGRNDADDLREMIGDVKNFTTIESLQEKVASIITTSERARKLAETRASAAIEAEKKLNEHKINLAKKRAEKLEEEKNKLTESFNAKLNTLSTRLEEATSAKDQHIKNQTKALQEAESRIAELSKGLNRATTIAEELRTQHYADERSIGHPKRKEILESVTRGRIKTKSEVNKLAESLEPVAEEPGGVGERVRRQMSRGRESMREVERIENEVLTDDLTPIPGLEGVDVSVEEVLNLARIEPKETKPTLKVNKNKQK
jgi:Prohead core protein serine protease